MRLFETYRDLKNRGIEALPTVEEIDNQASPEQTVKDLKQIKDGEVHYNISSEPGSDYSLEKYGNPFLRNKDAGVTSGWKAARMLEEADNQLDLDQMSVKFKGSVENLIPFTPGERYYMDVKAIFRGNSAAELSDTDIRGNELEYRFYSSNVSEADYSRMRGSANQILEPEEFEMTSEELSELLEEKRDDIISIEVGSAEEEEKVYTKVYSPRDLQIKGEVRGTIYRTEGTVVLEGSESKVGSSNFSITLNNDQNFLASLEKL